MKLSKWLAAALCALSLLGAGGAFAKDTKKAPNEYPNATRAEPKVEMSTGDQRDLNKAADLVNADKAAEAQPLVEKVLANGHASKYAQAFAHQLLGQIYYDEDKDNSERAIAEYRKATDLDAMPNAAQFQIIYSIAQLQLQD